MARRPVAAALLLSGAAGPCHAGLDPRYTKNITAYHLNPKSAGAIPVNMDTGDAAGDLYFYLGEFLLPLECANISNSSGGFSPSDFDCNNPERVDPDLVVTKVDLEVDARMTTYSACNLCDATNPTDPMDCVRCNGTDPWTGKPCKPKSYVCKPCVNGTYTCDCENRFSGGTGKCNPLLVGAEDITENFVHKNTSLNYTAQCKAALQEACGGTICPLSAPHCDKDHHGCYNCTATHGQALLTAGCEKDSYGIIGHGWCRAWDDAHECTASTPDWACWRENIPRKTGGTWWSTLAQGQCDDTDKPCGWRVMGTKTVREPCLKNVLMTTVERSAPTCFAGCGPRNATSPCWIGCFMDAILGRDARDSMYQPLGGMALPDLIKGWTGAFLPEAEGGCPAV